MAGIDRSSEHNLELQSQVVAATAAVTKAWGNSPDAWIESISE